jgi:hypothetical protein
VRLLEMITALVRTIINLWVPYEKKKKKKKKRKKKTHQANIRFPSNNSF